MKNNIDEIGELLFNFRRKIIESEKNKIMKDDLTFSQFETLWFIGPGGKKTMESIAKHFNIKPPSVTSIVDKMKSKGIIKKVRDKKDKRIYYVSLTSKAEKHFSEMKKHKEKIIKIIVSKLSEKDKEDLKRIISIIVKD
jgi:DNA-binding MarR family transcriptional regulator